jgi:hypothetical protein
MNKFFMGEMTICYNCDTKVKSNPRVVSQWTIVEANGKPLYVCPKCFGNNPKYVPRCLICGMRVNADGLCKNEHHN